MMTPEEFAAKMREIDKDNRLDVEQAHSLADKLLCDALREWGFSVGVDIYEDMTRWYG